MHSVAPVLPEVTHQRGCRWGTEPNLIILLSLEAPEPRTSRESVSLSPPRSLPALSLAHSLLLSSFLFFSRSLSLSLSLPLSLSLSLCLPACLPPSLPACLYICLCVWCSWRTPALGGQRDLASVLTNSPYGIDP